MSGIDIICGSFRADEKSGSAIEGVLRAVCDSGHDTNAASGVRLLLDLADRELIEIPANLAAELIPSLVQYRCTLVAAIGHEDWFREAAAEEAGGLGAVEAKWGRGRGWQLYCCDNLLKACETSKAESSPIYLIVS